MEDTSVCGLCGSPKMYISELGKVLGFLLCWIFSRAHLVSSFFFLLLFPEEV